MTVDTKLSIENGERVVEDTAAQEIPRAFYNPPISQRLRSPQGPELNRGLIPTKNVYDHSIEKAAAFLVAGVIITASVAATVLARRLKKQ